jgi:hypothetical protein
MAQKQQPKKKDMSNGAIALMSAGALALAAGTYYFFGPEGKKHRGKLRGWMISMKGDIVEKLEEAKELTQPVYEQIIDTVSAKYLKNSNIDPADVKALATRLKRGWRALSRSKSKKPAKKVAKKATKKAAAPKKKTAAKKKTK